MQALHLYAALLQQQAYQLASLALEDTTAEEPDVSAINALSPTKPAEAPEGPSARELWA